MSYKEYGGLLYTQGVLNWGSTATVTAGCGGRDLTECGTEMTDLKNLISVQLNSVISVRIGKLYYIQFIIIKWQGSKI